jgi:molecular chaperone DnaK
MFEVAQNGATQRAAQLAGFEYTMLLQEPIAAAIGYGFNQSVEDEFWLVYDLGGGTFDTSLLATREGDLTVVDHSGDNFLGGKDFDWLIVEHLMIPHLQAEHDFDSLSRGNDEPWCTTALAKLKRLAEGAKMALSRATVFSIYEDDLFEDESGEPVDLELEISQSDYNDLIEERIDHTVTICRDLLAKNNLSPGDVTRLILVGGPTNTPYLREKLVELGIQIEVGVDPMTVVARGAAIYASTQKIPKELATRDRETGQFYVDLEFKSITQDEQPLVGGRIVREGGGDLPDGLQVEIRRGDDWRSGNIPIDSTGMFMSDVIVTPNQSNEFQIKVQDSTGSTIEVSPSSFTIIHGGVTPPDSAPLSMSIRLAKADGTTDVMIEKGTPYPCKSMRPARVRTAKELQAGTEDCLVIPIVQGEREKSDRNLWGGQLTIPARDIRRVLPAGSEVEVEISVDENGVVSEMTAFVVDLDEHFTDFEPPVTAMDPVGVMRDRVTFERQRLERLSDQVNELGDQNLQRRIEDLTEQDLLSELDGLVDAQEGGDVDASGRARALYLELAVEIDEIEELVEWPKLTERLEVDREWARKMVQQHGTDHEQTLLETLEQEADTAIKEHDVELLKSRSEDLDGLYWQIHFRQPASWISSFEYLTKPENRMKLGDENRASSLFDEGRQAIAREDWDALQSVVRNLWQLLPSDEVAEMQTAIKSDIK